VRDLGTLTWELRATKARCLQAMLSGLYDDEFGLDFSRRAKPVLAVWPTNDWRNQANLIRWDKVTDSGLISRQSHLKND
jgi:hypothetical protein